MVVKGIHPHKSIKAFLFEKPDIIFNFLVAHGLFWAIAVPTIIKYGYSDSNESRDDNFGIASGPSGNGAFPVLLMLMVLATAALGNSLVSFSTIFILKLVY